MPNVNVFRDNNGTYYTCCCRVVIPNDYEKCPRCKQHVISLAERYESTYRAEQKAQRGRLYDQYRWTGRENAAKIAARLEGISYSPPYLCSECGWPIDDCKCWKVYQDLKRKRRRRRKRLIG